MEKIEDQLKEFGSELVANEKPLKLLSRGVTSLGLHFRKMNLVVLVGRQKISKSVSK